MNYNEFRRKSREVKIKNIAIGANNPIAIQTMANADSADCIKCVEQVKRLERAGADIIRIAVPNTDAVKTVYALKDAGIKVPLVADIHFDYKLALASIDAGIDKIRINPGNIGSMDRVKAVADACLKKNIPIRIGVNSGSVQKELLAKYGGPTPEALCESALMHAKMLEECDFYNTVISVKASDVRTTIAANRLLAQKCDYPLHLGVTEAGTERMGIIKSSVGIGSLLADGIGDTIRVSLTADPEKEIAAAHSLLNAIGIDETKKINIVSCPSCGRTKIDLISIAGELEKRIDAEIPVQKNRITVAVMGCVVNGPGEASEADIGIAGGNGEAVLFKHGVICKKLPENEICDCLIKEIKELEEVKD